MSHNHPQSPTLSDSQDGNNYNKHNQLLSLPAFSSEESLDVKHDSIADTSLTQSKSLDSFTISATAAIASHDETDEELPKPWHNLESKIRYHISSIFVTRPRLLSLYLLFRSTWPRVLMILDMYTDVLVAIDLYLARYTIYFTLCSIFIALPLILTWCASLRFLQTYLNNFYNKYEDQKHSSQSSTSHYLHHAHSKTTITTTNIERELQRVASGQKWKHTDASLVPNDRNGGCLERLRCGVSKERIYSILLNIFVVIYICPPIGALIWFVVEMGLIAFDVMQQIWVFFLGLL